MPMYIHEDAVRKANLQPVIYSMEKYKSQSPFTRTSTTLTYDAAKQSTRRQSGVPMPSSRLLTSFSISLLHQQSPQDIIHIMLLSE